MASTFAFLVLLMLAPVVTPASLCLGSPQTDAVVDDDAVAADDPQVNALIRDLRDPKFAVREAASHRLTEIGSPAITALTLANESDSLEVRVRAQSILASILEAGDSSFGKPEQATIKQFKEANAAGRVAILREQAQSKDTAMVLRLLDIVTAEEANSTGSDVQVESPIETLVSVDTAGPLTGLISNSLIARNWSDIDKLLTHPGILKYLPMLRVNKAHQAGKLEAYIEDRYQEFSQAHTDQQTIPTRELISLIGLFRVQRDFERAETVIGWLPDEDIQRDIRNELVFQQGDWQEVLRRSKLDATAADFIPTNLPQQALLYHLLGDQAGIAGVVQQLRTQLQAAIEAGDPAEGLEETTPVALLKSKLRIVGAISLDWPLMTEFFDSANLVDNFDLMVAQNRATEALELIGVGPGFKGRQAWMEATLKEIDEASDKMKKRVNGGRIENFNDLSKLVSDKTLLASAVAQLMAQWGLDDESQLYFQMIYAADEASQADNQAEILEHMMELDRADDYWQLVASILSGPNQRRFIGRSSFGVKDFDIKSLATQWASRIRGAIADPLEQAKTVAAVINSPWKNREEMDFDLDFEIARFRTRSELSADGADEFVLAQVFELNGRDEAASQMLEQAATLGSLGAIQRLYQQALAANDTRGILKYWIGAYNGAPETCLIAERAALELLETETDPDEIKRIRQQLKICRLAIAAKWIGGNTWDQHGFLQLHDIDESQLAILRLQCMVYGVAGNFLNKTANHNHLGHALSSKKANRESQASIERATVTFNRLATSAGTGSDIGWSVSSMSLNLALAEGMIARGGYDEAADLLVRQVEFSPGDVSVGESTVKKLDQAGATAAADRVYQAVEKHFVETLKAYPESPINRNNYAWLSATSNRDLEMARRHAMVAVKVRPNVENYLDTLAEIEFLLGRPKEAFELSSRCIQLRPGRNYYRKQKERFRQAMSDAE